MAFIHLNVVQKNIFSSIWHFCALLGLGPIEYNFFRFVLFTFCHILQEGFKRLPEQLITYVFLVENEENLTTSTKENDSLMDSISLME